MWQLEFLCQSQAAALLPSAVLLPTAPRPVMLDGLRSALGVSLWLPIFRFDFLHFQSILVPNGSVFQQPVARGKASLRRGLQGIPLLVKHQGSEAFLGCVLRASNAGLNNCRWQREGDAKSSIFRGSQRYFSNGIWDILLQFV